MRRSRRARRPAGRGRFHGHVRLRDFAQGWPTRPRAAVWRTVPRAYGAGMTTEIIEQEPWVEDATEPTTTTVTKHKGPVLLRRDQVQATTTDQRLLDTGDDGEWVHTDPWRVLRIQAEFVEGFGALATLGPAVSIFGSADRRSPTWTTPLLIGGPRQCRRAQHRRAQALHQRVDALRGGRELVDAHRLARIRGIEHRVEGVVALVPEAELGALAVVPRRRGVHLRRGRAELVHGVAHHAHLLLEQRGAGRRGIVLLAVSHGVSPARGRAGASNRARAPARRRRRWRHRAPAARPLPCRSPRLPRRRPRRGRSTARAAVSRPARWRRRRVRPAGA